jgi:hypothetical protein
MAELRSWSVALALFVAACGADAPSTSTLPPPKTARVPFSDYQIAGAHLFLHQDLRDAQCDDCESRSYVEGESLIGDPLPTEKLFLMAGRLDAPDLARRAMDILLSRVGEEILGSDPKGSTCMEKPDLCDLVAPPKIEGDKLTFWINEGAMHPRLTRVDVDLNTAEVTRTSASEVASPSDRKE